ncbi:MAG: Thioesterase [Proteobacteria bacterium]|nr:Thioesterase [Pseudomonadota bacterium]
MNPVSLYCFPYAGGNAWSYRPLAACCPPALTVTGIELPGRGRRSREALCTSLEALADDCFAQLRPALVTGRYALFGHSMGALLAYLCTLRIRQAGLPLPEALILCGQAAPGLRQKTTRHLLPRSEFIQMLHTLGGCPPKILQDDDLLDYFEPILRADFQAIETWQPNQQEEALPVSMLVLRGTDEDLPIENAMAWSRLTTGSFECRSLDGDHFFIQRHWPAIATLIVNKLGIQENA